jgi:hypothetical protein
MVNGAKPKLINARKMFCGKPELDRGMFVPLRMVLAFYNWGSINSLPTPSPHVEICLSQEQVYLSKVKSYDWRSVGQSVRITGRHLGPPTNYSFSSFDIIFGYLRVIFHYGELSLTRRWVSILLALSATRPWNPYKSRVHAAQNFRPYFIAPLQGCGGSILTCLHTQYRVFQVKVKAFLWATVSRPVYPRIRPPSGTRDQFFYLAYEICLQTFAVLLPYYWAPSLTRGCVCSFLSQRL